MAVKLSEDVTVVIVRRQDGEQEREEYAGSLRELNNRIHVTFSEIKDDSDCVKHLLKIDSECMEWIRSCGGQKSKTTFKAGEALPFLFNTPHGDISLCLVTKKFSYTKKDTHEISVSYSIEQDGSGVSNYETRISIISC